MATTPAIEWTKQWGSRSYTDTVTSLATGVDGAVYAAEFGGPTGDRSDFLISLSPNGTTIWRQLYSGPGFTGDPVSFVATDAGGSVYVAGTTYGKLNSQSSYNPFVTRFNADGTPAWTTPCSKRC